jgi:phosphoribosylamine--glycine ligase
MKEVIQPTLDGLRADGIDYLGFLYAGLMISTDGTPKVLEFNCRFGDPETQPIMARLNSDLVDLCKAAVDGNLTDKTIDWDPRAALGVVMAAGGYPTSYRKGDRIDGLPEVIGIEGKVFHAGTAMQGDDVVTSGGRVLCVVGLGDTVAQARDAAYAQTERISWDDHFFRRDIGHRAISREQ